MGFLDKLFGKDKTEYGDARARDYDRKEPQDTAGYEDEHKRYAPPPAYGQQNGTGENTYDQGGYMPKHHWPD